MRNARTTGSLVLSIVLAGTPALAQQRSERPLTDSASAAGRQAAAAPSTQAARRPLFLTGVIVGLAGGAAIIVGTTVAKSENSTSGNTPEGAFARCEALQSNPVYRGNECGVLKGPNKALVIGGAIAAGAGVTLALLGSPNSSATVAPGFARFRYRVTF